MNPMYVVVPNAAVGHEWLKGSVNKDSLNKDSAIGGKELITPTQLAHHLLVDWLFTNDVHVASPLECVALMMDLLKRHRSNLHYFQGLEPNVSLAQAFFRLFLDIGHTGVSADHVQSLPTVPAIKGEDIAFLYKAYLEQTAAMNWLDEAQLLQTAVRLLQNQEVRMPLKRDFEVPLEEESYSPLERAFIREISAGEVTSCSLVRSARADLQHVTIGRAYGKFNEAKETFRLLKQSAIPFDRAAVYYTQDEYVPYYHDLAQQFEIPMTFAEGLPVFNTQPGQFVSKWFDWLESDFEVIHLIAMLRNQQVRLPVSEQSETAASLPEVTSGRIATALERANIGWGLARYDQFLADINVALAEDEPAVDSEAETIEIEEHGSDMAEADAAAMQRELQRAKRVYAERQATQSFLEEWLQRTRVALGDAICSLPADRRSESEISLRAFAAGLLRLLEAFGQAKRAFDGAAKSAIIESFNDVAGMKCDVTMPLGAAVKWLRMMISSLRTAASSPLPGCLHVAPLGHVLYGSKPHVFIVGMSAQQFRPAVHEDPLLDDRERLHASSQLNGLGPLPYSGDPYQRQHKQLSIFLNHTEADVTLTYSELDLTAHQEMSPSGIILDLIRRQATERNLETLEPDKWLAAVTVPIGSVPIDAAQCLNHTDLALFHRTKMRPSVAVDDLQNEPELPNGRSMPTLSPSKIEAHTRCPRKYFYAVECGYRQTNGIVEHRDKWLEINEYGDLCHNILEEAFRAENMLPGTVDDAAMQAIIDRYIELYTLRYPSPGPEIYAFQTQSVKQTLPDVFQAEQRRLQKDGMNAQRFEHQFKETLQVDCQGTQVSFELHGKIDRLDGSPDGKMWSVTDYKTGKVKNKVAGGKLMSEAAMQVYLYMAAMKQSLSGKNPPAMVTAAHYVFITPSGVFVERVPAGDAEFETEMNGLLGEMIGNIYQFDDFPMKPKEAYDCTQCEFNAICDKIIG